MLIEIEHSDDRPIYLQIAAAIRGALSAGRLAPGDRLPTGRELAGTLDVNLDTVQRAYRVVADEGLVVSRVGRGTRVADNIDIAGIDLRRRITELVDTAASIGVSTQELAEMVAAHDR